MCDGPCSKKFLILLNCIFFFFGAALLGIGIWMKVDPMIVNYLQVVNINASDPLIDHASIVFIVVGAAAFIISFIGCCGAIKDSQGLLFVYIVLLLLLISGEIVGAVLAIVYRGEIEAQLGESLEKQIKEDYVMGSAQYDALNYMQTQLKCCGGNNYTDYMESAWYKNDSQVINGTKEYVPMQCCKLAGGDYLNPEPADFKQCQRAAMTGETDNEFLYSKGCHDALQQWFQHHSLIMLAIAFSAAAVQLLGVMCACSLRRALRDGKYVPGKQ